MRYPILPTGFLWALLITAGACRQPAAVEEPVTPPDAVIVDGTVRFIAIEGGCWAISVGAQTQYEARGLPDAFKRSGLAVRAAVREPAQWGSYCMIGPVVDVLWIRAR